MTRILATNRMATRDFKTCLKFNNTSSKVSIKSMPESQVYTISAWIKTIATAPDTDIADRVLTISRSGVSSKIVLCMRGNKTCVMWHTGSSFLNIKSTTIINDGRKHYLEATIDGNSGEVKLYVDGVLENSNLATAFSTGTETNDDRIGCTLENTQGWWDGYIDEVIVHNRVLTETERNNKYYNQIIPTDGLIAYYKFDEGSGTEAVDSSGNVANGTITDGEYVDSFFSLRVASTNRLAVRNFPYSLGFDGIDDFVEIADHASLKMTNALTISAWIYPVGWGGSNVGRIFDKNTAATNDGYMFYLYNIEERMTVGLGGSFLSSSANAIKLNKWQMVTVTWDRTLGSDQVKFYVNGVAAGVGTKTTALTANTIKAIIGNRLDTARTFDGKITNVNVWNIGLISSQVASMYYNNIIPAGAVGKWLFTEGADALLADASGNGNDGVVSGAVWSELTPFKPRTLI